MSGKDSGPATFGVLGGGWRALFFLRAAAALPDRLRAAGLAVRDPDRGAALEAAWGIPTYRTWRELAERHRLDFMVVSVPRDVAPEITLELAEAGIPVLLETPPAADVAALGELHRRLPAGALVQVAEQYQFQPMHAARIELARSGLLGPVRSVTLSVAHEYHAISLMRLLMGLGFEDATIRAQRFTHRLINPPYRDGWPKEDRVVDSAQVIAAFDFGDRLGVYDFAAGQYFSPILRPRVVVRGERGELIDDDIVHLRDARTPLHDTLTRREAGRGGNMEGLFLYDVSTAADVLYRNPVAPARLTDDEVAVATCLLRMHEHVQGGPGPYDLAQAMQDQYLSLVVREAVDLDRPVTTTRQPWAAEPPPHDPSTRRTT